MGGPSYQTPYPVDTGKGKQVIWNWGSRSWGPYTAPAKGSGDSATRRGDGPDASGQGGSNAPDREAGDREPGPSGRDPSDTSSPGPSFGGSTQQLRRGRVARRGRGALPGSSLLMDAEI